MYYDKKENCFIGVGNLYAYAFVLVHGVLLEQL